MAKKKTIKLEINDFQFKTKKRTVLEVFDYNGRTVDKMNIAFEDKEKYVETLKKKWKVTEIVDNGLTDARLHTHQVEIIEDVMAQVSFVSNEFGNNAFVIDPDKTLVENLVQLVDKVADNAKDYGYELCEESHGHDSFGDN